MIGGVCLGIATFFNIDVTLVRIVFALFALVTGGWGVLAYLGLMFILPRATSIAEAAAPAPAGAAPVALGRRVAMGEARMAVGQTGGHGIA